MARPEKLTVKQVIEALKETKGLVYLAAKKLGVDPDTVSNYAKRYPTVKATLVSARGEVVDLAEAKLYQATLGGEQWAVLFTLRTQGKERGYVERVQQEVAAKDGWRDDARKLGIDPDLLVAQVSKQLPAQDADESA
jgi:hypothetical protein